jgi:hypothetical protein
LNKIICENALTRFSPSVQIWQIADQGQTGFLDRREFNAALKLVTVAQSGRELTADIARMVLSGAGPQIPLPRIAGKTCLLLFLLLTRSSLNPVCSQESQVEFCFRYSKFHVALKTRGTQTRRKQTADFACMVLGDAGPQIPFPRIAGKICLLRVPLCSDTRSHLSDQQTGFQVLRMLGGIKRSLHTFPNKPLALHSF